MDTWLIASNLKTYNSIEAFKDLNELCWNEKQVRFAQGDIVYIYIASPVSAISIKCKVTSTGILKHDIADDKYWVDMQEYTDSLKNNTWMHLKLINIYDIEQIQKLKGKVLKNYGLRAGFVLSRQRASDQLLEYINTVELSAR
jgi:hypothetical protein